VATEPSTAHTASNRARRREAGRPDDITYLSRVNSPPRGWLGLASFRLDTVGKQEAACDCVSQRPRGVIAIGLACYWLLSSSIVSTLRTLYLYKLSVLDSFNCAVGSAMAAWMCRLSHFM
jgi:hypothetical protein